MFGGATSTKKKLCGIKLSDTSFYAKVDKDLTSTNQQIVKSSINDLIVKQELPATATNLIITTPRTSCIYLIPKIHKPNNPGRPIEPNEPKPELYRRYIDDCIGATSSTREDLNQFITAVNSFHPTLKYTWEIPDTSLAFLDIKVSIEGNGLCTSVHYKPTDSHSYLLYSSSHPSRVKNSILYSQFLRLRRLCSDDSNFSLKSEEMCDVFDERGYPASVVQAGHHRAQQIDRQSALQTSQKQSNDRIPFTLTFHPQNHAVKSIILRNFKLLQNDPDTVRIFSQPPLLSFKRDKKIGNFLVRSAFQTSDQPGTFKCASARCKTCPFIRNVEKISEPMRSRTSTDHFTCTSAYVINCITCTLCKKLYIEETGRRLGDRDGFREHLCDVEKDENNASKLIA